METAKVLGTTKMKRLAEEIVTALSGEYNITLGKSANVIFSDGECAPQIEESVRGQKVFIIGSTNNNDIMETLLTIDAVKRAAADSIVIVLPYYGYARQDRKDGIRGPVGAKVVADLLQAAGASEIISIDLHAAQIQGFFNIPFDHIEGHAIFSKKLKALIEARPNEEFVVCTPDQGGFQRASKMAEKLNLSMVAINKHRDKPNSIGSMELIGNVKGKHVIIVDDMCDTAGTLCKAADYLIENGASHVTAVCTHPVLSGPALQRIKDCDSLTNMLISDTIDPSGSRSLPSKIITVSSARMLAKVISRIVTKQSINEVNTVS